MEINIKESGILFGSYNENKIFQLETELNSLNIGNEFKKVEFILNDERELIFLEAKSSIPRKTLNFSEEIKGKYIDSLLILIGALLNRNKEIANILNENMKSIKILNKKIKFVLVISEIPDEYLSGLQDKMRNEIFCKEMKALGIKKDDLYVLNERLCRKYGLVGRKITR